jgi:hypothetical protein
LLIQVTIVMENAERYSALPDAISASDVDRASMTNKGDPGYLLCLFGPMTGLHHERVAIVAPSIRKRPIVCVPESQT